ncbi:hypothetical protein ANCDUO_18949, partial [Ancylostoma duodenale]
MVPIRLLYVAKLTATAMVNVFQEDDVDVRLDIRGKPVKSLSVQWYAAAMAYSLVEYAYVKRVSKERNATCMHIGVKSPTVAAMDDAATKECVIVREAGQEMDANCVLVHIQHARIEGFVWMVDVTVQTDGEEWIPVVEPTQMAERNPTIVAALVPAVELIPATTPTEKPRQVSRELDRQKLPEPSK